MKVVPPLLAAIATCITLYPTLAEAAPPIRVGAISALSIKAPIPESSRVAKLYFDAINSAGGINGRKIEYISEDEGQTLSSAAAAGKKFATDNEVVALIGGAGLLDCLANAKTYEDANLMSIQGASVTPPCFASSHIVPMNNGPFIELENAIKFASEHLKSKRICISILDLPGLAQGYQKSLSRVQEDAKKYIQDIAYLKSDEDFSTSIRQHIKRCDSVIFTGHEPAVLSWIAEIQKQSYGEINWIFQTTAYTDLVAKSIKDSNAKIYAMASFEPWQSSSLEVMDWRQIMRKDNLPLSSISQGGYVSAQLFVRVAQTIDGPINRTSFSKALRKMPSTNLSFLGMPFQLTDANMHTPNRASLPVQWRNGQWKIASPFWIQANAPK